MEKDCQFTSIYYGKFVTSQTVSFSRADIRLYAANRKVSDLLVEPIVIHVVYDKYAWGLNGELLIVANSRAN